MNKNTIIAFMLFLLVILFFNSNFYYEKILRKPHPSTYAQKNKREPFLQNADSNTTTIQQAPNKENGSSIPYVSPSSIPSTSYSIQTTGILKDDTVKVENNKFICKLTLIGAKIISIESKEYKYLSKTDGSMGKNIQLIPAELRSIGGANLTINKTPFDNQIFSLADTTNKNISISDNQEASISFFCSDPVIGEVRKTYSFTGNSYKIKVLIASPALEGKTVSVGWKCGIAESETDLKSVVTQNPKTIIISDGKSVEQIVNKKEENKVYTGYYRWTALTSKYFIVALIADSTGDADINVVSFKDKKDSTGKNAPIDYAFDISKTAEKNSITYWLYTGATDINNLKKENIHLEKVLFSGWKAFARADLWFPPICEVVLWILIVLNTWTKDYGLSIILLTILAKVVTFPLTQSSMKSMNRMKMVQPKLEAIRQKHKANPKKMNEEVMKLYKDEGINPLNPGCLPMFLQMPILFALFVVLGKAIELRGAATFLVPWVMDLSRPEVLFMLPFEIPMYGSNFALLPIIMAALTFVQNKMTIKDPNQKMMIYLMPIFMLVLFNSFAAGLVMYWTFSSVLGIGQQYLLDKTMPKAPVALAVPDKNNKNKRPRT